MNMRYDPKVDPSQGIGSFLRRARNAMSSAAMSRNLSATRKTRMLKTFSLKEVSEHTGLSRRNIERIRRDYPHAPQGEAKGREVQFTADDIMRLRIYAEIHPEVNQKAIFWREKGSQLPVIVAGSQKGGSAKSLTSCNLALYIQLAYGLRVSIIDADPQATASLYFADDTIDVGSIETQTFTNFMGMQDPGDPILVHDAEKLDTFWKPSPWPGIRILPGGPSIQEGDINLFFLFKQQQPDLPMFHELLKSALKRYDDTYQPRTKPADLVDENGAIIEDRYQAAMTECIDVVIIDCAPVLSMTMLNTIVAGTSLIVPSPLKGFDLNTTRAYTSSAAELISYLEDEQGLVFDKNSSFILPTIVSQQNMTDLSIDRKSVV